MTPGQLPADGPDELVAPPLPAYAELLVTGADDAVLLVGRGGWRPPGGVVGRGESPRVAARRTATVQLGRRTAVGSLLGVDFAAGEGGSVVFVFDGGVREPGDAAGEGGEGGRAAIRYARRDELAAGTAPGVARRLTACLAARHAGLTVYLENGGPPVG